MPPNLKGIVTVCGDPGGAEAIAPVLALLANEGRVRLLNFGYNEAPEILRRHGVEPMPDGGLDAVLSALAAPEASLLFTATSQNGVDWEKHATAAAGRLGVRSIALVDFWSNYAARFSDDRGRLSCLPDWIAAMDERARNEMASVGIPPDRIVVTGQPAFDGLMADRSAFTVRQKAEIRSSLCIGPDEMLVLFASQPIKAACQGAAYPGFDEEGVLGETLKCLETASARLGRGLVLLIRPHPREQARRYGHIRSEKIRVLVSASDAPRSAVMASDLVVGMNSVLLLEACYLGCPVVSLQPGLRGPDSLPTNAAGLSRGVYQAADIPVVLGGYLLKESVRPAVGQAAPIPRMEGGSTRRVADLVCQKAAILFPKKPVNS